MALADIGQERTRVMGRANRGERSYLSAYDQGHTQKYNAFAEEARQNGITDPVAIDQYAREHNQQYWSDQSATGGGYLDKHPWVAGVLPAVAGLGAYGLGTTFGAGAGGTTASSVGEGVG